MSVTSTPSTPPLAPVRQSGRQTAPASTTQAGSPAGEDQRAPTATVQTAAAQEAPTPSPPTPAAIGFSLTYDPGSDRMILEAREPGSGFVINQMPPKYVIKQFNASVSGIEPARGAQVDGAA